MAFDTSSLEGLAVAQRLDGPHGYAAVIAHRCGASGTLFQVYARPNALTVSRLGIIVSKRLMLHAVARNYCKRLMREVFRSETKMLPGMDIVVRPRSSIARANAAAARTELSELLRLAYRRCGQAAQLNNTSRSRS